MVRTRQGARPHAAPGASSSSNGAHDTGAQCKREIRRAGSCPKNAVTIASARPCPAETAGVLCRGAVRHPPCPGSSPRARRWGREGDSSWGRPGRALGLSPAWGQAAPCRACKVPSRWAGKPGGMGTRMRILEGFLAWVKPSPKLTPGQLPVPAHRF